MKISYGERLRTYLLYATQSLLILDFGDSPVFAAVAYPCIFVAEKSRHIQKGDLPNPDEFKLADRMKQFVAEPDRTFRVMTWTPGRPLREFPLEFDEKAFPLAQRELKPGGWRLEGSTNLRLLERIRAAGKPLGEYVNGCLYNGIKTGLNEAFVVDRATRDNLISEHKSSAEILKPFLRGRDIKRWRTESENPWLIFTRRGIDIKKYPAIHDHLKQFKKELMPGVPGGRKPGSYEWYEIQDNLADWKEFEQPKIIIPAIEDDANEAPDFDGYYSNDKTSIIIPPSVPFTLAILNSQVSWWITPQTFASKQGGYYEFKPMYVSNLPVPAATPEQQRWCERLAEALIWLNSPDSVRKSGGSAPTSLMAAYFEQWLNGLVYELFFPAELHARNLRLFVETAKLEPLALAKLSDTQKLTRLTDVFEQAYKIKAPLREMLESLRTVEPVKTIEGTA